MACHWYSLILRFGWEFSFLENAEYGCLANNFEKYLLIHYTENMYKVYKDKSKNCSCNQFHYIGTYKQVEKNSMIKNRGGNDDSEK
jgi:hypothetical protein